MALVYFDSSALVKLLVDESGTDIATALWDGADAVASSGLAYPEVRAALARALRSNRLSARSSRTAKKSWESAWGAVVVVEPRPEILIDAGEIAERHGLRGYDAVHLASALALSDRDLIMAVWDDQLRTGADAAGLLVAPA